ncbi:MAG: response regulator transcription factor [Sphingomonas sp.]
MGVQPSQFTDGREIEPIAANLTPTQLKVLQGVRSGRLNKQIAYDLGIAEATVKAHMTALMRKLNVHNRTQVAVVAQTLAMPRGTGVAAEQAR